MRILGNLITLRRWYFYFIIVALFLEYKHCQEYNNVLIISWMHMISNKKPSFLIEAVEENNSRNLIKKLYSLVKTDNKNRFFYIQNLFVNNC